MSIPEFITFLGWCTLINLAVLLFSTAMIVIAREGIADIHSRLFGVDRSELPLIYFDYLGRLKVLWIIFNLVPWLSLEIMY